MTEGAEGRGEGKWQRWDLNPGVLTPKLFPLHPQYLQIYPFAHREQDNPKTCMGKSTHSRPNCQRNDGAGGGGGGALEAQKLSSNCGVPCLLRLWAHSGRMGSLQMLVTMTTESDTKMEASVWEFQP